VKQETSIIVRGGSWFKNYLTQTVSSRGALDGITRMPLIGFRVVGNAKI